MQRKKKLIYNTLTALVKQCIVVICGFVLPRYMLLYYGSDINGTITSITQMLSFISLLEMGIGPVIQSNLYKPLADQDVENISRVVKASEHFFRRIAYIFIVYIIILIAVYPQFMDQNFDSKFTIGLIIILSLGTLAQYYFGVTYQILLNADQKSYVQLLVQSVTILLNTILSVILIINGASVMWVKTVTASIYIFRPIILNIYVRRHYSINKRVQYVGEPIKQKWNGFAQHIAAVVCGNTDVFILTIFSSMKNVSIYSVYFNVTNGITSTIMTAVTGLESLWGNMIANNEYKLLLETFTVVEWLVHFCVTIVFAITGIMIVPFISVYTSGINDANYIEPLFGTLLVFAYGLQCLRIPYFRMIKAAGHYKETQNGAMISMILNILISIVLVRKIGLVGTAIGTFVALAYHTVYFVFYLKKQIIHRNILYFVKLFVVDMIVIVLSVTLTMRICMTSVTYLAWATMAVKVTFVVTAISIGINFIFYRKHIEKLFVMINSRNK